MKTYYLTISAFGNDELYTEEIKAKNKKVAIKKAKEIFNNVIAWSLESKEDM